MRSTRPTGDSKAPKVTYQVLSHGPQPLRSTWYLRGHLTVNQLIYNDSAAYNPAKLTPLVHSKGQHGPTRQRIFRQELISYVSSATIVHKRARLTTVWAIFGIFRCGGAQYQKGWTHLRTRQRMPSVEALSEHSFTAVSIIMLGTGVMPAVTNYTILVYSLVQVLG